MKVLSTILFVFLTINLANAQNVNFNKNSWSKILTEAKKSNKPIFLDIYATWCGPCKMLDKEVYRDKKVGKVMNAKFINVKIDAEKGEGIELAQQFNIDSYPTLIFLNSNGEEIYRYSGFRESNEFLTEANLALVKMSEPSLTSMENLYKNGKKDEAFLFQLINKTITEKPQNIFNNVLVEDYFTSKNNLDALSDEDLLLIWNNMVSIKYGEKAYLILKKNVPRFMVLTSQPKGSDDKFVPNVDTFIGFYEMERAYQRKNEEELKIAMKVFNQKSKISSDWFIEPEKSVFTIESDFYKSAKNYEKYFDICKKYLSMAFPKGKNADELLKLHKQRLDSKLGEVDPENPPTAIELQQSKVTCLAEFAMELNNVAWSYYELKATDIKSALEWSKLSLEISPESAYIDTYAHLLFMSGKKTEAIKQQERAIKLAETNEENTDELKIELEKMKTGSLD
jgi:thiol-disulfide isomerase/thioredoxin